MLWWYIAISAIAVITLIAFIDGMLVKPYSGSSVTPGLKRGFGKAAGAMIATAFFAGFIATMMNLFLLHHGDKWESRQQWTQNLENIRDGSSTHGTFFLGIGTVNSVPSYSYYVNNGGAYTLHSVDADDAEVFQDASDNPRVECWKPQVVKIGDSFLSIFHHNLGDTIEYDDCYYIFHVPPNSIVNTYELGK